MSISSVNVLDFIRANTIFHSEMKYNIARKSFDLKPYKNTEPGIYFILDNADILKIGKAEGKLGLKGRIATYRTRLVKQYETGDATVILWNKTMTTTLNNKVLNMYLLPLEPRKIDYKGVEVEMLIARSLEHELSKLARSQGNTMLLSGQD